MDIRARTGGGGLASIAIAGTAVVVAAFASMLLRHRPVEVIYWLFMFHNGPSAIVLLWMSRLVLRRQPGNGAGLVLLVIGLVQVLHIGAAVVVDARLMAAGIDIVLRPDAVVVPATLPLHAAIPLWVMAWSWVPAPALALTLLLLLFPDGRLPSHRWRPVVGVAGAGAGLLMFAFMIDAWPTVDWTPEQTPAVVVALIMAGGVAVLGAALASVAALARRWRAADQVQRRQFRAVGVVAVALAVVGTVSYPWQEIWVPAVLVLFNAVLVAYALAVARYRLHDLEPVLGRAAVAAVLATLVAAVYLAVVVGVGSLVGRGVESSLLPLVAVGVVALLVEPARRRARKLVDRFLYGRRADRTEVLSRLAALSSTSVTAEEVLGEVVALLVGSTGATRAEIWLELQQDRQLAAAAGDSEEAEPCLRAAVVHRGERLGEVRLYARAAADLVRDAAGLAEDVARSLGVVLRNARLTAQLRAQLDELQTSRQRLVEVHDHARRELERDIHDGAQARLISLRLRLGLARALADAGDDGAVREQLDQLGREVDAAVRSLRELARGLHPPILEQSGVAAALRAHVRELPVAVSVRAEGLDRYPRAVEGAVYFACLEAVQNAVRYSGAVRIKVELTRANGALCFRVCDDGTGFEPGRVPAGTGLSNISDRISALGGRTRIESAPDRGTRVSGEIPVQPLVEER